MIANEGVDVLNRYCCSCVDDESLDYKDDLIDDDIFITKPIKIGKNILLYGKRKSYFPFHCLVGPDWPMIIIVYFLIISINAVCLWIFSALGWIPVIIGLFSTICILISYSITIFSDPGIIYKNDYDPTVMVLRSLDSNISSSGSINDIRNNHNINIIHGIEGNDIEKNLLLNSNTVITDTVRVNSTTTSNYNSNHNNSTVIPVDNSLKHTSNGSSSGNNNYTMNTTSSTTMMIPSVPPINTVDCGQCNLKRPHSARHCNYCGVCMDGLDHHCPW